MKRHRVRFGRGGAVHADPGYDGHYLWHAFFDDISDLAVDSEGNIYGVGSSATSWTGPEGELVAIIREGRERR